MSPFIHNRLFSVSGFDGEYKKAEISPDALDSEFEELRSLFGFNVTVPFKEKIIPFLDRLDDSAKLYGAVNTVKNENGKLIGYNTDAYGFERALSLAGIPFCGNVLICGCGGVARTIAISLALKGSKITFALRNVYSKRFIKLRDELKDRFNITVNAYNLSEISGGYDLVVNGTPVGMYPNWGCSILNSRQLTDTGYLFDTIYNPKTTLLVSTAKKLGITAVSGMGMLVMQAVKAHEYWYNASFNEEDITKLICDSNAEMERIFK